MKLKMANKLVDLRGDRRREQVAVDLGISYSALVSYETGERIPRDEVKIRISNYYNTPIQDIFYLE